MEPQGPGFAEMDINVHRFGFPAKRGLYHLQEKFRDIVFEVRTYLCWRKMYVSAQAMRDAPTPLASHPSRIAPSLRLLLVVIHSPIPFIHTLSHTNTDSDTNVNNNRWASRSIHHREYTRLPNH